jgi:hypothetical protein
MKRKLTFEISSAKDYFDQILLPSVEAYNAKPLSYKEALSAAIFCWQFSDWIYNSNKKDLQNQFPEVSSLKDYQGLLMKKSYFAFISQIAIGAKHLKCDDKRIQNISSTQLETGFYQGLLGLGTATYLTIMVGSIRYYFARELKKCMDYWNVVLIQLDIY